MKNQTLGKRIAALRKDRGMTQLELAEQMCVTDKAVSKWERDLSAPDVGSIPKLAEIFGISVDELMQGKPEPRKTGKAAEGIVDLALKAIGAAMGIGVTVLSVLGELESQGAFAMLGIGLAAISISLLKDQQEGT